jgi:hypothetical protein
VLQPERLHAISEQHLLDLLYYLARGSGHPSVLGPVVFATPAPSTSRSPGGRCAASARWLLDWARPLEALLRAHGQFAGDTQRDQVVAVIERARPYYRTLAT